MPQNTSCAGFFIAAATGGTAGFAAPKAGLERAKPPGVSE
jgi:hypothetical protein